jgi:DNA-binding transcriptional LysR family regulator
MPSERRGAEPGRTDRITAVEMRHLRAFVALAQVLHFGHAAELQGVSQSALSRTIAQLEEIIGEPLVARGRTTAGLTGAGRALLPHAQACVREVEDGILDAHRTEAAPVLGLMNSVGYQWLPALRAELTRRRLAMPPVRQITLEDGFEPLAGAVDVGIFPLPAVMPAGYRHAVLGVRRPWVALPADHRVSRRSEIRIEDLNGLPAIAPPAHELWDRNIELLLRTHDVRLVLGPAASSAYEVLELIAAGRGWSLSAALSDFAHWEGVVFRPLVGSEQFRVAAVWAASAAMPPRAEELIEALRAIAETPERL